MSPTTYPCPMVPVMLLSFFEIWTDLLLWQGTKPGRFQELIWRSSRWPKVSYSSLPYSLVRHAKKRFCLFRYCFQPRLIFVDKCIYLHNIFSLEIYKKKNQVLVWRNQSCSDLYMIDILVICISQLADLLIVNNGHALFSVDNRYW